MSNKTQHMATLVLYVVDNARDIETVMSVATMLISMCAQTHPLGREKFLAGLAARLHTLPPVEGVVAE